MTWGSPLLTWKGRTLYSSSEPSDQEQRLVSQLGAYAQRDEALVFCPSPAEGWGLKAVLDALGPKSQVVLFEKDPELDQVSRKRLGNNPRVRWLGSDSESAVQELLDTLPLAQLRRCLWLPLSGGWLLHPQRYKEIQRRLEAAIATYWSNRMTSLHLGPLWVRNFFDNLSNEDFAPLAWPDWSDKPVVVCGAGTTLEASVGALKALRSRLHILAADTALPVLLAAGVVPDAIVCVESQQANLRDFLPAVGRPISLFLDVTSHPPTTRALAGKIHWFATRFAPLGLWHRWPWNHEVPLMDPLGSVGVTAVAVAYRLSRGSVILTGLDFSWPLGKSHARGAPALATLLHTTNRWWPVEAPGTWQSATNRSVEGSEFRTTGVLAGYAAALAQLAAPHLDRTRVLGSDGLDTGVPRVPLESWVPQASGDPGKVDPPSSGVSPESVVEEEVKRLESTLDLFDLLNAGDPEAWPKLEAALSDLDYLWFAFADAELRRDSAFLSRVLIHARWMLSRISRRRRS